MESLLSRIASFHTWNHVVSAIALSRGGFYCGGSGDLVICCRCRLHFDNWKTLEELEERHRVGPGSCFERGSRESTRIGPDQHPVLLVADSAGGDSIEGSDILERLRRSPLSALSHLTSSDVDQLRSELVRLRTFQNCPQSVTWAVNPRDLAKAGFFYTGPGDRVQCAFCQNALNEWKDGDVPADEHRTHFPHCPYIQQLDVGNVPIQSIVVTHNDIKNRDLLSSDHSAHAVPSYDATLVKTSVTASEGAAARNLSNSGHKGNDRCYQCAGGLENWRLTDDPWSVTCPFLLAKKDQQLIPDAQIVRNDGSSSSSHQSSRDQRHVEPREINALMCSREVLAVLNMGFQHKVVRHVVEKHLTSTGTGFPNVESLVDAVVEYMNGNQG